MRAHREFGKLRAGRKADRQMDHGGRVERRLCGEQSAQNAEYNATCGHTSVAGDMLVSRKVRAVKGAKQGGTAGYYSSLTFIVRDVSFSLTYRGREA